MVEAKVMREIDHDGRVLRLVTDVHRPSELAVFCDDDDEPSFSVPPDLDDRIIRRIHDYGREMFKRGVSHGRWLQQRKFREVIGCSEFRDPGDGNG